MEDKMLVQLPDELKPVFLPARGFTETTNQKGIVNSGSEYGIVIFAAGTSDQAGYTKSGGVSIVLTIPDYECFKFWYRMELNYGILPFYWGVKSSSNKRIGEARIRKAVYEINREDYNRFILNFTIDYNEEIIENGD